MTTDTIASGADVHEALRQTCMLVTLSISSWDTKRVDSSLARDVAVARHSSAGSFSVRKNLFPGCDSHFKEINASQSDLRRYVYRHTLPFGLSSGTREQGPRLLSNDGFFDFVKQAQKVRHRISANLELIKMSYPAMIEQAERNLGDAFKRDDYPAPDRLDAMYSVVTDFTPVPPAGSFQGVGLTEGTLEKLNDTMEERLAIKMKGASEELSERVSTYLVRLHNRAKALDESLASGERKAALHATLFSDARDLARMVDAFPFVSAETRAQLDLLRVAASMDKTDLTEDDAARQEIIRRTACFNV